MTIQLNLPHPYARYGLAVAMYQKQLTADEVDGLGLNEIASLLKESIETGLNNFRLTTDDDPIIADILRFERLKINRLKEDVKLIQSAGLAAQGKYLAPSIVTTDGDAKGTWDNAEALLEELAEEDIDFSTNYQLSRSFAPTTAKINNGRSSQAPPKASLFEAACSVITTLTPIKPAAWIDGRNTAIIPDLPLEELSDFAALFDTLMRASLDGSLYEAKLPPKKTQGQDDAKSKKAKKPTDGDKKKSEYRRPRIYDGNYPFAPRNQAFGTIGLLGAIGKWAKQTNNVAWAKRVLEAIAGTAERPGVPLYIISYDSISQVQFTHHVVGLSIEGKLSELIDALIYRTTILSELEENKAKYDNTKYKLFFLMTNRFLQLFNQPAFRDFLATRAEYAPEVSPMFEEYFMNTRKIDRGIVESARAFGQWLNSTAYFVAKSEVGETNDYTKINKAKAKLLVEFESAAMSAENAQDMLHRISTRAGRLLQQDAPADAVLFMDAANSGEIEAQDALHLLISYLRIRTQKENSNGGQNDN